MIPFILGVVGGRIYSDEEQINGFLEWMEGEHKGTLEGHGNILYPYHQNDCTDSYSSQNDTLKISTFCYMHTKTSVKFIKIFLFLLARNGENKLYETFIFIHSLN